MNVANPISETPEQHTIRLKNLEHVRDLRGLVVKERSLARSAFERLTNNQKRYLLIASGIDPALTDWSHLTDNQVKALSIGIKHLKIIINEFVNCSNQDRQQSHLTNNKEEQTMTTKSMVSLSGDALLTELNKAKEETKTGLCDVFTARLERLAVHIRVNFLSPHEAPNYSNKKRQKCKTKKTRLTPNA